MFKQRKSCFKSSSSNFVLFKCFLSNHCFHCDAFCINVVRNGTPKEKHETETKMCDASWFQRNHSVRIRVDGAGMSFSVQLKLTVNELEYNVPLTLNVFPFNLPLTLNVFPFNHCPCCFWSFFVLTVCWHRSSRVLVSPTPYYCDSPVLLSFLMWSCVADGML